MQFRGSRSAVLVFAWFLAILHPVVSSILLFGWLCPRLFYVYGLLLVCTLLSWLVLGFCVLTRLEFLCRRQLDPKLPDYTEGYLHYHVRKVVQNPPSQKFIRRLGLLFLSASLGVWISNLFIGI